MWDDVRFAARRLASRPALTALMVLILALGIGANTAVFTIVDQTIFRLPPFANADRLVEVVHVDRPNGGGGNRLSPETILGWQSQRDLFDRFEGYAPQTFEISGDRGDSEPEQGNGFLVTTGLFDMLGVSQQLGRSFVPPDGRSGSEPVAIISDGLWQHRFGADRAVTGRTIHLNGQPYAIVGVMPHRFTLSLNLAEAVWVPVDVGSSGTRADLRRFVGLAWIPRGLRIDAVQTRANVIAD